MENGKAAAPNWLRNLALWLCAVTLACSLIPPRCSASGLAETPTGGARSENRKTPGVPNREITIRFLYDPVTNPAPLVLARVNGCPQPYAFVVDTGAAHTILNADTAVALLIKTHSGKDATGVETDLADPYSVEILREARASTSPVALAVRISTQQSTVTTFHHLPAPRIDGRPGLAGVLGMDAFKGFSLRFDFGADTLTLTSASIQTHRPSLQARIATVAMHLSPEGQPEVAISGGTGQGSVDFVVATGSPYAVAIRPDGASLLPQQDGVLVRDQTTIVNRELVFPLLLPVLRIGSLSEKNVEMGNEAPNADDPDHNLSRLGMNVLSRFVVTIDVAHRTVTFERPANAGTDGWQGGATNFEVAEVGGVFLITKVQPGLPAAAGGLRNGDRLISVDGYTVDPIRDTAMLIQSRVDGLAGTRATIGVRRGTEAHSVTYLRDSQFALAARRNAGKSGSIGVALFVRQDAQYAIQEVTPGGAADQAGIRAGDILLSVDGVDLAGKSPPDLGKLLSRPPGTRLKVRLQGTIDGNSDGKPPREVTVTVGPPAN